VQGLWQENLVFFCAFEFTENYEIPDEGFSISKCLEVGFFCGFFLFIAFPTFWGIYHAPSSDRTVTPLNNQPAVYQIVPAIAQQNFFEIFFKRILDFSRQNFFDQKRHCLSD